MKSFDEKISWASDGVDRALKWFVPKFLILLLGVGFGYVWCDYHYGRALDEIRLELQKKDERIERLIVALGQKIGANPTKRGH